MPFFRRSNSSFYSGLKPGATPKPKVIVPGEPQPDFPNGDFEQDFKYWTVYKQHVTPGGVSAETALRAVLGCPIPPDPSPYPTGYSKLWTNPEDGSVIFPEGPFVSYGQTTYFYNDGFKRNFETEIGQGGPNGKFAILRSGKGLGVAGGGVIFGPAIVSENPVIAEAGDRVRLNWKATANGDAYKIFSYLLNKETCNHIVLIDAVGNAENSETPWVTVEKIIKPEQVGNYYFVFICGSFDFTRGGTVGSELYIDEVKLDKAGTF